MNLWRRNSESGAGDIKSRVEKMSERKLKNAIRDYLVQGARAMGAPWRNKEALEQTVGDVLALDQDLRDYALTTIIDGTAPETDLGCEIASIGDLLKTGEFNPVTAALFVQWYRREPRKAAATLVHHDAIIGLPEEEESVISDEESSNLSTNGLTSVGNLGSSL